MVILLRRSGGGWSGIKSAFESAVDMLKNNMK
jgi:hypothetical protein